MNKKTRYRNDWDTPHGESKLVQAGLFISTFFFSLIYDKRYNWSAYFADSFPLYETSFKSANPRQKTMKCSN